MLAQVQSHSLQLWLWLDNNVLSYLYYSILYLCILYFLTTDYVLCTYKLMVRACVQFNAFIAIVKDMMTQVESEQRSKLEQLNSLQQENRSIETGR